MSPALPDDAFEAASGTLDERIQGALAKLALAARHDFSKVAAAGGLSATQAQALSLVAREGPLEVGELAARLALTPATVSDSVAALQRRGLVRREPVAEDRRRVRVVPTPSGVRLGRELATWPELFQEGLVGMPEEEKEVLLRALVRVVLALLARGTIQRAGMCVTCAYFRPNVHEDRERPHHCALADVPLGPASMRFDCPDHEAGTSPSEALERLGLWLGAP